MQIGPVGELILAVTAFIGAALTATVGLGGGVLLLMVMLSLHIPAAIAIPVHGCVQFVANISRALFGHRSIQWRLVRNFALGAVVGATLGMLSLEHIDFTLMPLVLGLFILATTWWPRADTATKLPVAPANDALAADASGDQSSPEPNTNPSLDPSPEVLTDRASTWPFLVLGCLQTMLSFFMGATGPLANPLLMRRDLDKHAVVVTAGAIVCLMHAFKVAGFVLAGVDLSGHLMLIVTLGVCVIAGSLFGTAIRQRVPQRPLFLVAKWLITLLALRMIVGVAWALLFPRGPS